MENSDCTLSAKQWIDASKVDIQKLNVHGNTISSKQEQVNVFGNTELSDFFSFSFHISKMNYFCIGIYGSMTKSDEMENADGKTKIQESEYQSHWEAKQTFIKFYNDGSIWVNDEKKKKITKFRTENVTVAGNLQQGALEWKVNDQSSEFLNLQLLKNGKMRWVPYICLWPNSSVTLTSHFWDIEIYMTHLASLWFDWDDDVICEINLLLFDHS